MRSCWCGVVGFLSLKTNRYSAESQETSPNVAPVLVTISWRLWCFLGNHYQCWFPPMLRPEAKHSAPVVVKMCLPSWLFFQVDVLHLLSYQSFEVGGGVDSLVAFLLM